MIGITIKKVREEKRISKRELAKTVGVSHQAVCQWESRKTNPSYSNLIKISEALDCNLDELANGSYGGKTDRGFMMIRNAMDYVGIKQSSAPYLIAKEYNEGKINGRECYRMLVAAFEDIKRLNSF